MAFDEAVRFLETNHLAVINTQRPNGAMHSSVVVCGAYQGKAAFVSVYPRSQKVKNLRRNSHCTVLTLTGDGRSYVTIEGQAALLDHENTDAETLRTTLRDVYMACSGTPHPDWEEFDEAMVKQGAVIVLVSPERAYGRWKACSTS